MPYRTNHHSPLEDNDEVGSPTQHPPPTAGSSTNSDDDEYNGTAATLSSSPLNGIPPPPPFGVTALPLQSSSLELLPGGDSFCATSSYITSVNGGGGGDNVIKSYEEQEVERSLSQRSGSGSRREEALGGESSDIAELSNTSKKLSFRSANRSDVELSLVKENQQLPNNMPPHSRTDTLDFTSDMIPRSPTSLTSTPATSPMAQGQSSHHHLRFSPLRKREDEGIEFEESSSSSSQGGGSQSVKINMESCGISSIQRRLTSPPQQSYSIPLTATATAAPAVVVNPQRKLLDGPPFGNVFESPSSFVEGGQLQLMAGGHPDEERLSGDSSNNNDISCWPPQKGDGNIFAGWATPAITETRIKCPGTQYALVRRRLEAGAVGATTLSACWISSEKQLDENSNIRRRSTCASTNSTLTYEMDELRLKGADTHASVNIDGQQQSGKYLGRHSDKTTTMQGDISSTNRGGGPTPPTLVGGYSHQHFSEISSTPATSSSSSSRHIFTIITGPHSGYLTCTTLMVSLPVFLYTTLTLYDQPRTPFLDITHAIAAVVVIVMLWSLWKTATVNPGIVPRGEPLEDEDPTPKAVRVDAVTGLPVDQYTTCGGNTAERRWCFICNVYRPLRASHCEFCNICVDRRDHHCPWTGTCIGRNNYPWFFIFIASTMLAAFFGIVASGVSFYLRVDRLRDRVDGKTTTTTTASPTNNNTFPPPPPRSPWSLLDEAASESYDIEFLVLLYCCCAVFVVGSLVVYHLGLIFTNTTTREDLRSEFRGGGDEHRRHNPVSKPRFLPSCCVPLFNCLRTRVKGAAIVERNMASTVHSNPFDCGSPWKNLVDVMWTPILADVEGAKSIKAKCLRIMFNISVYEPLERGSNSE